MFARADHLARFQNVPRILGIIPTVVGLVLLHFLNILVLSFELVCCSVEIILAILNISFTDCDRSNI